jgi:hypothetical protein
MRIDEDHVPVKIEASGASARLQVGFGDPSRYRPLSVEYFSLEAGADIAPLLHDLDANVCGTPHWGYLVEGAVTVTYRDGSTEYLKRGDLFYWPAGHTLKVEQDAELLMLSPGREHIKVLDQMKTKLES